MTNNIEAAVAAAIQASRPAGVNLWDVPELEQAIRHVANVARRDALRDVQCCQEYHDFAECPVAVALVEAEEAVRRDA